MAKSGATILGLAALAGAAIYVGQSYLNPASERAEQEEDVLTGALDPVVEYTEMLEDAELPADIEAPAVGDPTRYVRVSILYPNRMKAPDPASHLLAEVNGGEFTAEPVHTESSMAEDGARVLVVYRVDSAFEWGRLERDEKTVVGRFELE